jgi:hypothetical protein
VIKELLSGGSRVTKELIGVGMLPVLLFALSSTPPSDIPSNVPPSFDCKIREFALQFAHDKQLGPAGIDLASVHAALQLGPRCGKPYAPKPTTDQGGALPLLCDTSNVCVFVNPNHGDDVSSGTTEYQPMKTLPAALAVTRVLRRTNPVGTTLTIVLMEGTHFLSKTLVLTSEDSHLAIRGANGAMPTISGAIPLGTLEWKPHDITGGRNIWKATIEAGVLPSNDIPGLRLNGERVVRARHPNANPERDGLHTPPHTGWVPTGAVESWLPGRASKPPPTPPVEVLVKVVNRSSAYNVYPYYYNAIGGICNGLFEPNVSFWCVYCLILH